MPGASEDPVPEREGRPFGKLRAAWSRQAAWESLFPVGQVTPLRKLTPSAQSEARKAAGIIVRAHREYFAEFNALTAKARDTFENRDWMQGALDAERRVRLYRTAVDGAWRTLRGQFSHSLLNRDFWLGIREAFVQRVFDDYDADLALTLFYSTMRLAFDPLDIAVEYADDGLAEYSHVRGAEQVWESHDAAPEHLSRSIVGILQAARSAQGMKILKPAPGSPRNACWMPGVRRSEQSHRGRFEC
jgi:hypothetical protein